MTYSLNDWSRVVSPVAQRHREVYTYKEGSRVVYMNRLELTDWQMRVLDLMAEGYNTTQIGRMTCRTREAIKQTRLRILKMIGLEPPNDRYALLKWMSENGWDVDEKLLEPQNPHYIRYYKDRRKTDPSENRLCPPSSLST